MTDESSITKRIDRGLERYYGHKGTSYKNEEGENKFMAWVDENGYDTETIEEEFRQQPEDAAFIDFDDDFPTDKTGDERPKEIFKILTACFKDPSAFFNSPDLPDEDEQIRMAYENSLHEFGGSTSASTTSSYQQSVGTQSYQQTPSYQSHQTHNNNYNDYTGGGRISGVGSSSYQNKANKHNYGSSGRSGGGRHDRPFDEPYGGDEYREHESIYGYDNYERSHKRNKGNMDDAYHQKQRQQQQQKSKEEQRLEQARKNGYISSDPCYESQLTSSDLEPSSIKDSTLRSQYKEAMDLKNIGDKAFAKENYKKALKNYSQIFIHLGINGTRKLRDFCGNDGAENPLKNNNKIHIGVDKLRLYGHIQMAQIYSKQKKWKKVIEKCSKVLDDDESNLKALLNRAKGYRKLKKFEKAKDDLNKAKKSKFVDMEIELELQALTRNQQGKFSDDEEENDDYGIGGIGGIGGGGIGGGIGGIGGPIFTTFSNDNYPQLPLRDIKFEQWLKNKNKKRSLRFIEDGLLYPVPNKKPQYRVYTNQEILDMAVIYLDCDVVEKIISLDALKLDETNKDYNGAIYVNQLSTGTLLSGFKYEYNVEKFDKLLEILCKSDSYIDGIDVPDNDGRTALANTVKHNTSNLGIILLRYGADINHESVKNQIESGRNTDWVRTSLKIIREKRLEAIQETISTMYGINENKINDTILDYILCAWKDDTSVDEID